MPDLDRPRLALYVALALVACFLGARYLRSQANRAAARGAPVAAQARHDCGPRAARRTVASSAPTAGTSSTSPARCAAPASTGCRRARAWTTHCAARGAPRRTADLTAVNLAAKLEDGRQILVPRARRRRWPPRPAWRRRRSPPAAARRRRSRGGGAPGAPRAPVNLNTATLEQLDTLDGVGPGIAQRILDYRAQHGGFRRVEELGEVPGIGDKRLATLTPLVTV